MKNIEKFNLIIILSILQVSAFGQSDMHGFSKVPLTKTFNTEDYQGGIQNWDIAQNQLGYIYVANNYGLLEYDGIDWRNYLVVNNTRVRSIFIDSDERIYIGGQNQFGYFEANKNGSLTFVSLYEEMDQEERNLEDIWKIFKFNDKIYFSSYQGLVSYDGNSAKREAVDFDHELAFQVANRLFLYSPEVGLGKWSGNRFERIPGSEFLRGTAISSIIPHLNNSFLIFQQNGGVYQYKAGHFQEWKLSISDFLKTSLINTVILLDNNHIAIGTQNNGLIILSPQGKVLKHLTKGQGLNNRTVLSLHEDSFNNLWVGLNNGITMVELGSPFSMIDEQSGLPGTGYCTYFMDNKLYLGTSNGVFYQEVNPNPIQTENQYELIENTNGQVYNIQQVNNDLFLSHHDGAFTIKGNSAEQFFDETGVWKVEKTSNDNQVIIGTYEGFRVFDKVNGAYKQSSELSDFNESSRVFHFISDTSLFMTHGYKGAYKITFNPAFTSINDVHFYGSDDGFPSNILINVFDIGNEYVFAAETGIYTYNYDQDNFTEYSKLSGYFSDEDHIREMVHDHNGSIFFSSTEAIGYLEKTPFDEYTKHTAQFSRIRKFLSDDLENISVVDHQNVFFGAKEGFIHYNPSVDRQQDQPFNTFIREISAKTKEDLLIYGGSGPLPQDETSLPAYFPSLKFSFAAPYFDGQDEIEFQYYLENFDNGWSEWSDIVEKEYTNLSQGSYTFHVRAKNVFNEISKPATFTFTVFPPWYQSQGAYISYAFALLVVFGASLYRLDKKHKQERAQLTEKQKQELQEKESEIEQVSKKSKEEITRLRNEKLRAEVDHKNRELATNTMHLIKKNEFMVSLKDSLQDYAKKNTNSKDALKKIVRDIDRNLSEDDGWDQFTKHFDQVHGNFLKSIKRDNPTLTPQEIKLCAYLRMNMTSKEIANLLNISVRGVEISRYRLRKKLGLDRETNLVDYMLEYS